MPEKKFSIEEIINALTMACKYIHALEQRIEALEKVAIILPEPIQTPKDIKYFSMPDGNECFNEISGDDYPKCYKLEICGSSADFSLEIPQGMEKTFYDNRKTAIEPACETIGIFKSNAKIQINGTAELQHNGKWKIIKKARVQYE